MWLFWFTGKMFFAALAFLLSWFGKKKRVQETETFASEEFYIQYRKNKGRILGRSVGLAMKGPKFRLVRESKWDVRFKNWGLSNELQTGDQNFDDLVYIVSDNDTLGRQFRSSEKLRNAIVHVLSPSSSFNEIECDGEKIWLSASGRAEASSTDYQCLLDMQEGFQGLNSRGRPFYREPFYLKAITTEAMLAALGVYGIGGVLEHFTRKETFILLPWQQLFLGLGLALGIAVGLMFLIRTLFGGSSRGHRVILESTLLLIVTLPMAGFALVEDINVGLDENPTQKVVCLLYTSPSPRD